MATVVRNTGTRFRYDGDSNLWEGRLRMKVNTNNQITFEEFLIRVATLAQLLDLLASILSSFSTRPDTTVEGAEDAPTVLGKLRS